MLALLYCKDDTLWLYEPKSMIEKISSFKDIPFGYELSELDFFATIKRYEEGHVVLTKADAAEIVKLASECLAWVKKNVSK